MERAPREDDVVTLASSADRYPALPWPDGLRRIRPAHVIRCGRPEDMRLTEREPYVTIDEAYDAWLRRIRSASC